MAIIKNKDTSEVTVVMNITITDIFKVPDNEEKAEAQTDKEIKRLMKAIQKASGVDKVELQKTKVFPNIKTKENA